LIERIEGRIPGDINGRKGTDLDLIQACYQQAFLATPAEAEHLKRVALTAPGADEFPEDVDITKRTNWFKTVPKYVMT